MPNSVQNVGFQSPGYDYGAELSEIGRRQRLADALQQQSMEPIQEQQGGRFRVPISPFQGLAKLAQGYTAGVQANSAQKLQTALAQKAQADYSTMLKSGIAKLSGSPVSEDASGNVTPAQAPDPMGALEAFGSHPMGAQFMPLAMQEISRQRLIDSLKQPAQASPSTNPMVPGPGASVMAGSGSVTPQASPQAASQPTAGGPAGGQPMSFWLQLDPTGKLYGEQLAKDYTERQKPVVDRGFGIKTYNPATGKYDLASNPEDIATVERAKAGVAAAYGVHPVTNASGATVPTFGYQLPGFGGLGNTSGPQTPAAPTPQPAPKPAAPAPQPAAAPAAIDPWTTMPKRPIPQGVGQSTYDRTISEHQATTANELSKKYGELADHANQRKVLNDQALSLVDKSDTGPAAAGIADIKNWLTSRFGIAEDRFQNTPSATIALQKDLLNAATQKAKAQFGTRMTQNEVMLMLSKGAPNVDMTKAAIKYLINSDNASADYQIKQANDFGTYLQKGGDPLRFDSWYSRAFPMTNAVGQVHLQTNPVKDIVNSGESKTVDFGSLGRGR